MSFLVVPAGMNFLSVWIFLQKEFGIVGYFLHPFYTKELICKDE